MSIFQRVNLTCLQKRRPSTNQTTPPPPSSYHHHYQIASQWVRGRGGGEGKKAFTNPYNLRSRLLGDDETCFATKKNCFFKFYLPMFTSSIWNYKNSIYSLFTRWHPSFNKGIFWQHGLWHYCFTWPNSTNCVALRSVPYINMVWRDSYESGTVRMSKR